MILALGLNNPRTGTTVPAAEGVDAVVEGPTKGLDEPVEGMSTVLALARSLLPTAPLLAVECNLPVLEVQRYICLYAFCLFFYHDSSTY